METSYSQNQTSLNPDSFLTEDFLGLTSSDDSESFFNSLSDEDFSGSELSSEPSSAPIEPFDPNNNLINFYYSAPTNQHVFLKQEDLFNAQQMFMMQVPQLINYPQGFACEPPTKIQRTSTTQQPQMIPQFVPQVMQFPPVPQASAPVKQAKRKFMEVFPEDKLSDFKRVIYNLLVEHHNQCLLNNTTHVNSFILPVRIEEKGKVRTGFQFNEALDPEKKIPELYAQHIRNARLETQDKQSVFVQDLYRFYLRACLELLGKYFDKKGKFTFLDDEETPLFVPGRSIAEAEIRIRSMKTRARMNKKRKTSK